ncbi:MAG: prepilin-type N-terminal cleavage/methylation domain-containing protein [Armatimonadetes bacterium]|nr:prepilin-type N-terminal cleavage/methylation domain-containing protein [Armatimonadota bacterium]
MKRKSAFTLIELLVVIAIIAILAAILFPVFAQAKVAAKKTQDISNQKQIGTATHIYMADYDDLMPLVFPSTGTTTEWLGYVDTPADWDPTVPASYHDARRHAFPNSVQAYVKNGEMFKSPGASLYNIPGWVYPGNGTATLNNYSMNGLLTQYPHTSITDVARLRMMTTVYGNRNWNGAMRPGPRLWCQNAGTCRFVPSSPTCNGAARNGEWSEISNPGGASMWLFGQGVNAVYADSHAKFNKVAGGATNASDFRTDFWAVYQANGVPSWNEWQDTNFCHTLLFQPDFDFQNFGTPVLF